ncbi:HU family DNA-binding protein [bacterium]|nr:HU family DNA-binding protein [bacterium]HPF36179.1 HU family DNA-binding protein [Candidatus Krumholzibacteria bacterium]HRX51789.1 HU family DNA-binding protein [Candidatus Krumholzibacteria bacterium]
MATKTTKKATAKKPAPVKAAAANKPPTKTEVYRAVAEKTGLARKDVVAVMDAVTDIMSKSVKKYGEFNYMGLMKMTLVKKPAVKGGKLVKNPFTGEMVKQKPRAASRTVKVRPMKAIKDML